MKKTVCIITAMALALGLAAQNSEIPPYKNPELPTDQRVADLLQRMTLKEKFWQMFMIPGDLSHPDAKEMYKYGIFGFQTQAAAASGGNVTEQMIQYDGGANGTAAQTAKKINEIQKYFVEETRLGIPIIAFDEALHGLIRSGATAFPQSIALAATWDTTLMKKVGTAVALETKSRGIRDILSPVVNVATDPRWGRTEETYGEDPYLSARMGVAYVKPFEQMGVITTPKHFIANEGTGGRDSYPIYANERLLQEIYLPPFEALVKEGGSRSVMTAYNSWDATACTSNSYLLRDVLKHRLGFEGFVISDAGATGGACVLHNTASGYRESTTQAVNGGLDVIFQTAYEHWTLFWEAFEKGEVDMAAVDEAVGRILKAKFDLGLFENPYVDEDWAARENNSDDKRELCREAARESFVLLKNEGDVLPLDARHIKSLALIGGEIKAARLGGYSGPGCRKISIYDGVCEYLKGTSVKVNYAEGSDYKWSAYSPVSGEYLSYGGRSGVHAEYYDNNSFSGDPVTIRQDGNINFGWTLYSPDPDKIKFDCYSAVWTGKLKSPAGGGRFALGIEGNDGYRLWIDGKLFIDNFGKQSYRTIVKPFDFAAGKEYDIKLEFYESAGSARLKLVWNAEKQGPSWQEKIDEAVRVAAASDVAVVAVGIHEGEFQDRALLSLPGRQEELINAVKATGKPVVVLLVGGSAITTSGWEDGVPAIMDIWYPGETGGQAVADVLFGDFSPSGKLPLTFPIHEGQLPLVYNHRSTGRGDDYHNLTGQPLYPFGYGLSYTTFEYSDLKFSKSEIVADEPFEVSFTLANTGRRSGTEVVQLYVRDVLTSVSQPIIRLADFQRVSLAPGESARVSFLVTPDKLKYLDGNMQWRVEPGEFRIMIGSSSKDIRLRDNILVR